MYDFDYPSINKARRIEDVKRATILVQTEPFVPTSLHKSWRGKVKCFHCPAKGYANSIPNNTLWWGHYHGQFCSKRWEE